ncbi:hypothetical protein J19TS2_38530 [Cohnella xylanilytica]|uniref:glycosyltransferase n=1 Tax=Cohnella xylanilytica TaxID=557555 RepID=UPI001B03829C|nr:glycosyltransferase [Cohnella xylanilytica]GIO14298.1 hypothetical protein J19TS2_38530 [Cohnella xylanilytica]
MKYSFVIPTYNNKPLLRNTLESLNHQIGFERGGYEAIVVDDGSDDDTLSGIRDIPRTYEFRYVYLERSAESCRARVRNIGWREARGRFVVFLDSDMIVNRDYLRELDRYLDRDPELLVISFRYMLQEPVAYEDVRSGRLFERDFTEFRSIRFMEARHFDCQVHSFNLSALRHPWHCVHSCNMALSKEKLEALGGFEERFKGWGLEDTDLGYRSHRLGIRTALHLGAEALHQYHGEVFGDARMLKKMIEWDRNITLMFKIRPGLRRELPRWRINLAYFTRRVPQLLMRRERKRTVHRLSLRREEDVPAMMERIEALSAEPGNLIVVQDELESADFHLWVQRRGFTPGEIRYFPKSYTLDRREIRRYFGEVFTWRKKIVILYRSLRLLGRKFARSLHPAKEAG